MMVNNSCNGACCCNAADDDGSDAAELRQLPDQLLWKPWPAEALSMAKIALELTQQEWSQTGLGKMRLRAEAESKSESSAHRNEEDDGDNKKNDDDVDERILNTIIERIVALLLIRIVALVASRLGNTRRNVVNDKNSNICVEKNSTCRGRRRGKIYSDYSTTTICKTALQLYLDDSDSEACCDMESGRNSSGNEKSHSTLLNHPDTDNNINTFPSQITPTVVNQLQQYVTAICRQYPPTKDVPYHNVEHAYHVFISANKLLDLLLCKEEHTTTTNAAKLTAAAMAMTITSTDAWPYPPTSNADFSPRHRQTFGLKYDPLSQLAFLFSALVHDVDHKGITNRQLVLEQDDLAVLYNDQSVAEQRSLAVAFTTLKGFEYDTMREVLFPTRDRHAILAQPPTPPSTEGGGNSTSLRTTTTKQTTTVTVSAPRDTRTVSMGNNEDFLNFRKLVIDLVLVTDIASPERTQIAKSKWKEAFGGVVVAEKLRKRESASSTAATAYAAANPIGGPTSGVAANGKYLTTTTIPGGGVVARLGSQTSSKNGSDSSGLNNRRHSSFSDRHQSSLVSLEQQQSTQSKFIPSMDLSNKQPHQEVTMPQNVNFFLGESMSSSTSSPSLSTIQSNEEDDFDASAVSRSKMNFNNDEIPSPSRSFDSMENLLEAAANYNLDGSDAALGDEEGGKVTVYNNLLDDDDSKLSKRSLYQHQKHQDEGEDNLDHDGEVLRWSTGDLSHSGSHQHNQRRLYPSPMRLSHSVKTPHEMRYMPRRSHKLGVRRALDLAGSTITAYSYNAISSSSVRGGASSSSESREVHSSQQEADHNMRNVDDDFDVDDDVDEFKATVVLEQMMHAADVAALFQDWENVVEWSTRLYKELNNGYISNRGDDPSLEWYENQMKFFDFYILPLAKNLAVMGVFDEGVGERFVHGVKTNMARWIREGSRAAQKMKEDEEVRLRRF